MNSGCKITNHRQWRNCPNAEKHTLFSRKRTHSACQWLVEAVAGLSVQPCPVHARHTARNERARQMLQIFAKLQCFGNVTYQRVSWHAISYRLSREYRVAGKRYLRLLFTSEDRMYANLRVHENRWIWPHDGNTSRDTFNATMPIQKRPSCMSYRECRFFVTREAIRQWVYYRIASLVAKKI